jgi:hypothetical protein
MTAPKEQSERVRQPWTEAESAALREGFASGKSWKEIAKGFPGRTTKAVEARGFKVLQLKRDESDAAV